MNMLTKNLLAGAVVASFALTGAVIAEEEVKHKTIEIKVIKDQDVSVWVDADPDEAIPIQAEWKTCSAKARHTFTHFHLLLTVKTALVPMDRSPSKGFFIDPQQFDPASLPTVMRKAFVLVNSP